MQLALEEEEYDRAVRLYGALETFRLEIRYAAPQASNQKTLEMRRILEEKLNSGIFSDLLTEGESFTIEEALKYASER